MNYRHAFHAGNFADVFKHIILVRIIEYLKRKEKAFRVYDTHAGRGSYQLSSAEADKTLEWTKGIALLQSDAPPARVKALLAPYLEAVGSDEGIYPGSPLISRRRLRKQDRLSVYEKHPEEAAHLRKLFAGDYQVRVNQLDGWLVPGAHLPPKEARGLMLIDPPFEESGEFDRMIDALEKARHRWSGGTIALWYPVKQRSHTDEWLETLKMLNFPSILNAELTIRPPISRNSLNGCGMVIVNPPYLLEDELQTLLPFLANTLGEDKSGGWRLQSLSR